jgi:hypothetical protein
VVKENRFAAVKARDVFPPGKEVYFRLLFIDKGDLPIDKEDL